MKVIKCNVTNKDTIASRQREETRRKKKKKKASGICHREYLGGIQGICMFWPH